MIGYVILHYKNITVTKQCINSLLKIVKKSSIIVVVDNGSANGSFEELQVAYGYTNNIEFIKIEENLGFARGNNLGYRHIKNKFAPEAIVVCNSDLIFEQNDFEDKLMDKVIAKKFDVAGPDIINIDGLHQNPHRTRIITYKEIRKMNSRKRLFLIALYVKKAFPVFRKFNFLERRFDKGSNNHFQVSNTASEEMVLQGSCIIFGGEFIKNEDQPFCSDTFLYFEEDLLSLLCLKKHYRLTYEEEIFVRHLEGGSTSITNDIDRRIYIVNNMLKSGKIYEKHIKEFERQ